VLVHEGHGYLMVLKTGARNYLFIFSLLSKFGFSFSVRNLTDDFMRPYNSEMKQETNVVAILT
jgi:hypothetical protein